MINLARRVDRENPVVDLEVQETVRKELIEAGIKINDMDFFIHDCGEVPTSIIGTQCMWHFKRAWYYWVAKGPGIPMEKAEEFDKQWGKEVRADGDCACRGPKFWNEGFGTDCYHIDSQAGLNAFTQMLKEIHIPRKKED
jgi:hypothetical protein